MSARTDTAPARYHPPLHPTWFLRRRGYSLYVIREFTAVPIAAWMIWFLVEISRLGSGSAGYHPHLSVGFVIFSVVCLIFALWHSVTFLSFSGLVMRIPFGMGVVPARFVSGAAFAGMVVASAVIIALLLWGGR